MSQLSHSLTWELAQEKWSSAINPVLALPILAGTQLTGIKLKANVPLSINHLLQRMPQGWFLTDNQANATIWRSSPSSVTKLVLTSSDDTTVDIWVF